MKYRSQPRLAVQSLEAREVPAVVSGSVYLDANGNGLRDCGEAGIPNVTVKLVPVCGCPQTTTTDCNGDYVFCGVGPGDYKIVECQPPGYCDGFESVGGCVLPGSNLTDTICITVCDTDLHCNNFGEVVCRPTVAEGLTPGFWKNNAARHGASAWVGYSPTQTVASVFGSAFGSLGSLTLAEALGTGGGGLNALLRHSVAAVLNAAHPEVDYAMTASQIIAAVQSAVSSGGAAIEQLKNQLDANNNAGANLNQHGQAT